MKKIVIAAVLALFTANMAYACPKGTSLEGGTGPNHKGGKCVAAADAKAPDAKATCAAQAADKKLAGAAKNSFTQKCEKDAAAK
jgi:hypothetical protein